MDTSVFDQGNVTDSPSASARGQRPCALQSCTLRVIWASCAAQRARQHRAQVPATPLLFRQHVAYAGIQTPHLLPEPVLTGNRGRGGAAATNAAQRGI